MKELTNFDVQPRLNGRNHDDVFIRLSTREIVGDSHCLGLDNAFRPDDVSDQKVQEVFARLLAACAAKVEDLEDGESAHLPLDFQDEWLGCLRCLRSGDEFSLVLGELDENGYAVLPSEPAEVFSAAHAFRPIGDELLVPKGTFIAELSGLAMAAAAAAQAGV